MSCHDIGRGMNAVVRRTIRLFNDNRIGFNETKIIIASCAKAVNWCDGNASEAVDYISGCTCGKCLKKLKEGEMIYSLYDLPSDIDADRLAENNMIIDGCGLCLDCFNEIINSSEEIKNHTGVKDLMNRIKEGVYEGELSTGDYRDHNNKCSWGRNTYWFD